MNEYIMKIEQDIDGIEYYIKKGELIRCENCKHCETTDNYNYCKAWQRETSIDGYCHMGDAND